VQRSSHASKRALWTLSHSRSRLPLPLRVASMDAAFLPFSAAQPVCRFDLCAFRHGRCWPPFDFVLRCCRRCCSARVRRMRIPR
jgi:hypothetical protein